MGFSSFEVFPLAIKRLSYDCIELDGNVEEKWKPRSMKLSTDTLRNFTVKEYLLLSTMLKTANVRYNKKKDEFINIIQYGNINGL